MKSMFREMVIDDYDHVMKLWKRSEGVGLSRSDSKASIQRFLDRNKGLSYVATADKQYIGAVFCGHDGRRGYIHHLGVAQTFRRQGIGRSLVDYCLHALMRSGIDKCHIFMFKDNMEALAFWNQVGWIERVELKLMSKQM